MTRPRGFVRCIYVTDEGVEYQLQVDAESAEDAARGWVTLGVERRPYLPRGFLPRRVVGVDESGRQQSARVATVDAALWTGTVLEWTFEASDGSLETARVTNYQQERQVGPHEVLF
jgi:hypothetical protein